MRRIFPTYSRYRRRRLIHLALAFVAFITVYVFIAGGNIPLPTEGLRPALFDSNGKGDGTAAEDPLANVLAQKPLTPMSYGTAARPAIKGLTNLVADLPAKFVPGLSSSSGSSGAKRLIIVGDVHGMRASLEALLKKINFDRHHGDHLVLTGDMVSKGPDTPGVVTLAMELGASAVRGNHEDRILLARASIDTQLAPGTGGFDEALAVRQGTEDHDGSPTPKRGLFAAIFGGKNHKDQETWEEQEAETHRHADDWHEATDKLTAGPLDRMEENPFSHGDFADRETAASLTAPQIAWLSSLPVILRCGRIPSSPLNRLLVVHAGLVPGIDSERQDPWAAMNMRSLVYPVDDERRARIREALERAAEQRSHGIAAFRHVVTGAEIDAELARLKAEDPAYSVLHDVALPVESPATGTATSVPWSEAWNRYQMALPAADRTTVVYGHDAKRGLQVDEPGAGEDAKLPHTFGLDSGCVRGGQLSALVIAAAADGAVTHSVVQVDCEKPSA